jgi:hypothetical protein
MQCLQTRLIFNLLICDRFYTYTNVVASSQAAEGLRSMIIEAGDEIGAEYKAPGQYVQVCLLA